MYPYQWTILSSFSYPDSHKSLCVAILLTIFFCCLTNNVLPKGGLEQHQFIAYYLIVFMGQESAHGLDGSFAQVSNGCNQSGDWGFHPLGALLSSSKLIQVVGRIQFLLVRELMAPSVSSR